MSHGGPEIAYREADGTVTANCSEYSDLCEYKEHDKCSGMVEHRKRLDVIDRATGDVVGQTTKYTDGHMCMCMCHF